MYQSIFTSVTCTIKSSRTNKTLFQLINFKVIRNDAVLILSHWSDEAVKYMDLKKSIGHFCHVWSRAMMTYYYNYYHST